MCSAAGHQRQDSSGTGGGADNRYAGRGRVVEGGSTLRDEVRHGVTKWAEERKKKGSSGGSSDGGAEQRRGGQSCVVRCS